MIGLLIPVGFGQRGVAVELHRQVGDGNPLRQEGLFVESLDRQQVVGPAGAVDVLAVIEDGQAVAAGRFEGEMVRGGG